MKFVPALSTGKNHDGKTPGRGHYRLEYSRLHPGIIWVWSMVCRLAKLFIISSALPETKETSRIWFPTMISAGFVEIAPQIRVDTFILFNRETSSGIASGQNSVYVWVWMVWFSIWATNKVLAASKTGDTRFPQAVMAIFNGIFPHFDVVFVRSF